MLYLHIFWGQFVHRCHPPTLPPSQNAPTSRAFFARPRDSPCRVVYGGAFIFVRSFVTRLFTNHFQSHICVPNVPTVLLCAKAPNLRLYRKVHLQRKSCATHPRTCPPLPQHTHQTEGREDESGIIIIYLFFRHSEILLSICNLQLSDLYMII